MIFSKLLEKIVIWEFLLFSGGLRFSGEYPRLSMILFVITSFCLYRYNKGMRISPFNLRILFISVAWVLINHLIVNTDLNSNFYMHAILYPIGSCLAISSFNLGRFKKLLLKYLSILAVLSIIVQVLHVFLHIPSTLSLIGSKYFGMCCYFFNVDWGENRLSSIYWEPGQFQIIIMFVLCLFIDELRDFSRLRQNISKFGILILAMFMTFSTTGYLSLGLLFFVIILFSTLTKKYKLLIPFSLIVSCVIAIFIWNTSVVQEKLAQSKDRSEETSYAIRMADNLALFEIAKSSPIFGEGMETRTFEVLSLKYGNRTSSNGWLCTAAYNGFPYLIFMLICIYMGIKRMNLGIPSLAVLGVLLLSQANEYATFFPYIFIYIFKFRDYKKLVYETKSINHLYAHP